MKENIFGIEIEEMTFRWDDKKPTPPSGYLKYNANKANCQSGKCPNCGHKKPPTGPGKSDNGFQDRQIQNLWRALYKLNNRLDVEHPNWKSSYELFSLDPRFCIG